MNRNKNENNANSKKQKQDMSERQTHVFFGVKISISGRKYDGNHTKTCAYCFKIEKKNKQLKSGSYPVCVMKPVFSRSHISNVQFYLNVYFG